MKLEHNLTTDVELALLACIVGFLLYVAGLFVRMFYVEATGNRDRLALARAGAGLAITLGGISATVMTPSPPMTFKAVTIPSKGR